MLKELDIENLAIIKKSNIEFENGFNVITGETGAGKSIILNALLLILGGRANQDLISKNSDDCKIQAVFDLSNISQKVFDELPDIAKQKELIINRIISKDKSKIFINGMICNLSTLESVTSKIISFCGQNQQINLLNPKFHLELLDSFSGLDQYKEKYLEKFLEYKKLNKNLKDYEEKKQKMFLRLQELKAIKEDLESINIKEERKEILEENIQKCKKVETLKCFSNEISSYLLDNQGVFSLCDNILKRLEKILRTDESTESLYQDFSNILDSLSNFEKDFNKYKSNLSFNKDELENLRQELSSIATLERKYATNEAGLIEIYKNIIEEISSLDKFLDIEEVKKQTAKKKEETLKLAQDISEIRQKNAKILEKKVQEELADLNLPNAKFLVLFNKTEVDENGIDDVEFKVSLNKGYEAKPLRKVASGGELSRILLVLKKIIKDKIDVNILVFDEVDSGMSGKSARCVGSKLKDLSQTSQIICITHLPQVASLADAHFVVSKGGKNKIFSNIERVSGQKQVQEIARMLSGFEITESAKASAKELIAS